MTQNPLTCRNEIGSPEGWRYWLMTSVYESQALLRILTRQGMAQCEWSHEAGRYLYIYPAESERFLRGELVQNPFEKIASN
jgi:hypothetical protein